MKVKLCWVVPEGDPSHVSTRELLDKYGADLNASKIVEKIRGW